mgnify:CR=1 FL=1
MYMGDFNPSFPSTISNLTGWYTGDSAVMSGSAMTEWVLSSGYPPVGVSLAAQDPLYMVVRVNE